MLLTTVSFLSQAHAIVRFAMSECIWTSLSGFCGVVVICFSVVVIMERMSLFDKSDADGLEKSDRTEICQQPQF